jgi:uncharacterized membrane protein YeaQ/YmgE (transglycosylase-associated protein family)
MHGGLIFWIVAGGIAGWLASLVAGTGKQMGCLLNILVGIIGAVIGGWIFRSLHIVPPSGELFGTIIVAFVGATVFLLILRALTGRRS